MSGDIRPITDEDLYLDVSDDRPLTKARARKVTEMIKLQVVGLWRLIKDAYVGRAWVALGYESWDAYCAAEFPTSRLRLPREERSNVVNSLREAGLSIRAIEAATGVSRKTVIKDINQVVETPPPGEAEEPPGGLAVDSPSQSDRVNDALSRARNKTSILGKDGKAYKPRPAEIAAAVKTDPAAALAAREAIEERDARQKLDRAKRQGKITDPAPLKEDNFMGLVVKLRAMKRAGQDALGFAVDIQGFEVQEKREIVSDLVSELRMLLDAVVGAAQGESLDDELRKLLGGDHD